MNNDRFFVMGITHEEFVETQNRLPSLILQAIQDAAFGRLPGLSQEVSGKLLEHYEISIREEAWQDSFGDFESLIFLNQPATVVCRTAGIDLSVLYEIDRPSLPPGLIRMASVRVFGLR